MNPFKKNINLSDLMVKAQAGDKKAYEKLLNAVQPMIEAYLAKRVFDKDAIPDITQTCLLAIHKSRHTYLPKQPFENWMYGIVKFKMIDYMRRHYRKTDNEVVNSETIETFSGESTNSKTTEVRRDLKALLKHLPKKQQKLITMLKIQGHSVADVAEEMDMTESNVKVTMHRALKKLQDIAEDDINIDDKPIKNLTHKQAKKTAK